MDSDNEALSCDVCGRLVRGALDGDRLSYCLSCQRFVCGTCWVPGRDICRLCLQPGHVVSPRLRPVISETFIPSTLIQPSAPRSDKRSPAVGKSPPRAPQDLAPAPGRTSRQRWLRPAIVGLAAMAAVVAGAALVTSRGDGLVGIEPSPPASREGVLSGGATVPPDATSTPIASFVESYTVQSGDTLREIARTVYGDELRWPTIYNANRDAIANGDALSVGEVLTIPRP